MGPNSVLISGSQVPTCGMFNFQMGGKMKTVQTQDHCSNTMLNYHLSNGEWAHLFFPLSMYMTVSNSLCIDHSHTRIFLLRWFSSWENPSCCFDNNFEHVNGCSSWTISNGSSSDMLASVAICISPCWCTSWIWSGMQCVITNLLLISYKSSLFATIQSLLTLLFS